MKKIILPASATLLIGLGVGLAINAPGPAASDSSGAMAPAERAAIEQVIRDYLLANPEIIPEAMEVLRDRMTASVIGDNADALFNTATDPVAGNPDGDVTIVEFFDYACGFCKAMMPRRQRALEEDGNIRLVLKDFPILSEASITAAKAALAAREQGKYMDLHLALMATKGRLTEDGIYDIAHKVGLNIDRLRRDMEAPGIDETIARNRQLARELGVSGTPAIIVGDTLSAGALSYDELMELVKKARSDQARQGG